MKSCKECGGDLLDINEMRGYEHFTHECEECGKQFRDEDLEGDFSTMALASTIRNGVRAETERDELKAKIKAFLEAWEVKPYHDGLIMRVEAGRETWRQIIDPSDMTGPRGQSIWDLWNAVNETEAG